MKKKSLSVFFVLISMSTATVFAEEAETSSATNGNINENWYFNFGLGGAANPNYGSSINGSIDALKSISTNFKRRAITADIGFYWPLESKKVALGAALFGISDQVEASAYKFSLTQSVISFSALWYPTSNIGDGFFLRGDLGPARLSAELTTPTGSTLSRSTSDFGTGAQLGLGYSLPVSTETRLALGLFFAKVSASGESISTASLQLSCML